MKLTKFENKMMNQNLDILINLTHNNVNKNSNNEFGFISKISLLQKVFYKPHHTCDYDKRLYKILEFFKNDYHVFYLEKYLHINKNGFYDFIEKNYDINSGLPINMIEDKRPKRIISTPIFNNFMDLVLSKKEFNNSTELYDSLCEYIENENSFSRFIKEYMNTRKIEDDLTSKKIFFSLSEFEKYKTAKIKISRKTFNRYCDEYLETAPQNLKFILCKSNSKKTGYFSLPNPNHSPQDY